jgi:hypothetical protein
MPVIAAAGAIGAAVTGGAVAAGSIAAAAIGGALVGAAAGAVVAAVKGGNILKGAIIGAIAGGIIGGVGAAATGGGWLTAGTKEAAGGLISTAGEASTLSAAAPHSGNALAGLEAAKAAAAEAPAAMGAGATKTGLTFGQQAILEGVKGGAKALLAGDDNTLEVAKMKYRPNEIPDMKAPKKLNMVLALTPAQQVDEELLDLKTMIAQITPQKPKGSLSVNPGSVSVNQKVT